MRYAVRYSEYGAAVVEDAAGTCGPMSCFADALRFFPDYGTAATHPQQTIFGDTP